MSTPNYKVVFENSQYRVSIRDGILNVRSLAMAPSEREADLNDGDWLVLAFAVWGSHDRHAIDIACSVATSWPKVHVGVRPFEYGDEFASWVPEFRSDAGALQVFDNNGNVKITTNPDDHPVWIAFRKGVIVGAMTGSHSEEVVTRFVSSAFQSANNPY